MTTSTPVAASPKVSPALGRALHRLVSLQAPSGAWEGEVVWNAMLPAQYVVVHRIVARKALEGRERDGLIRHFRASFRAGGWGMHPDSKPYVFFTAMAYVALRILGVAPTDPMLVEARTFLRRNRVAGIPSWGKLWLAMVGLYGWEGVNPIPPEVFLLPRALPLHPDRYYCHTRYIYLAISSLYGRRFTADLGPLRDELRAEIYAEPYESIRFEEHRHDISLTDLFVPPGSELKLAYDALAAVERRGVPKLLRERALARCDQRIRYELRQTKYQCISPVNGLLNCLSLFARDPNDPELDQALAGVEAWRFEDEAEGIRFVGARSHAWDTAFALRALLEAPRSPEVSASIRRGLRWLKETQITSDLPHRDREARSSIFGGWCFSDGEHRWPVSDCTAEALSAILIAEGEPGLVPEAERFGEARVRWAVSFILDRQNEDGGFGTYEPRRGGPFLEALNPSEMYGSCMTERSYLECTASCIGALARVRARHPEVFSARVNDAIARGEALIRKAQRPDGSWAGFWGVNFTYGIFHGVEGLLAAGASPKDPAIRSAVAWLEGKQKADGSWGEHFSSCLDERYAEHPEGQVIMTGWALLALQHAGERQSQAVTRGLAFLERSQRPDGSYPEQAVAGVFFGTAMLHYRLYKDYFPLWALGRAARARSQT